MTSRAYAETITGLISDLVERQTEPLHQAAVAVADALAAGGRIWLSKTTHCLHGEAHHRAGGYMAVHMLDDTAVVRAEDCVIVASPVGVHETTVATALEIKQRGATIVALTNVAFENDPDTDRSHRTGQVLHQIADIVVDCGGPLGDGVFFAPEFRFRIIPHSGVIGMAAMWMIFADAVDVLRERDLLPLMYQCVAVMGARQRNNAAWEQYVRSGRGVIQRPEVVPV